MSSAAAAELIADGGSAAADDEFFRSREFLAAEGVTHSLRLSAEGAELVAPLLVREVPEGDGIDAISPYGYPGLSGEGTIDPSGIALSASGLVSAFVRHRLGSPPQLEGATERNVVLVADPELEPKSRPSDRQQIRKNLKRGYEVEVFEGPAASAEQRQGFLAAYEQTMRRAEAEERYFYDGLYFERVLSYTASWLVLAIEPGGQIAAGSVAARSDGMLHYYLSGTADAHLRDSPMKNVVSALCELSTELGLPLNLGGGITAGDALEEFKRGFANREQTFTTSELVCDPDAYGRLSGDRDAGGFFPAYRAP